MTRLFSNEKTLGDLEFGDVLAELAARTRTAAGERAAFALSFAENDEACALLRAQALEAIAFEDGGSPLPIVPAPDVTRVVSHVSVQGVVTASDFVDLLKALHAVEMLRRFLASRSAVAPLLFEAARTAPELAGLARDLTPCFESDGSISDRASTKLAKCRAEHKIAKARLLSRAQEILRDHASLLQDAYITERDGRYVVPLRSDAHERFPGIVHGASASGGTLFVEPRALVALGNQLRVLAVEIEREEYAVLARLSAQTADHAPALREALHALCLADVRAATARLAVEFRMRFPDLAPLGQADLRDLRHPLLAFGGAKVVPSDVVVRAGQCLVVSGPNAGGKTVALKAVGLAALMLRAGLPVPCAEGSAMGPMRAVVSDVGDSQSLSANLSTFSAHLTHVVALLQDAGPGTLVLLDELASGTDPREGEALAAGVLRHLCAVGATTLVTTHYEGLKALALCDAQFANASVGVDLATMTPSFRLALGIPGLSQAFALAERLHMPSEVLQSARAFLAGEDRDFETTVRDLDRARGELERARVELNENTELLAEERAEVAAERARMHAKEQKLLHKDLIDLRAGIAKARAELMRAKDALATTTESAELKAIAKTLSAAAAMVPELPPEEPSRALGPQPRAEELRPQLRVWHTELRKEVVVLSVSGTTASIQAGALRLQAKTNALRLLPDADKRPSPKLAQSRLPATSVPSGEAYARGAVQTSSNTCDLRGLRADDAVEATKRFLDQASRMREDVVFLVHGHGTGALRDVVRDELHGRRDVAHFRAGGSGEGGDGATLVWLI